SRTNCFGSRQTGGIFLNPVVFLPYEEMGLFGFINYTIRL
ncbi:MAG: hypothetical protein JWP88_367, partial [Flaviaesturariibacter sp.]|nr:hypothetical protein [Flaviaesturariibacter sp.]